MNKAATIKTARQVQAAAAQIQKAIETLRGVRDARTAGRVAFGSLSSADLASMGLTSAEQLDDFVSTAAGSATLHLRSFSAKGTV